MARSAAELHETAVRLANQGRHSAATRHLLTAQELTEDPGLRARILGTLGYIRARTGDPEGGERLCREAMALPGIDSRTYALLSGQLGALAEQAGRYDDSEKWLTRGIDALAEDTEERANLLVNRSLVNMRRLRLSAASEDASAASRIFASIGSPIDEAQSQHNEGYLALLAGDLVTAMRVMSGARSTLAEQSPVLAAMCDMDRAEVLRDAGQVREAERLLAHAAGVFGRQRMPQSRAEAEFHLARSLLAHDPVGARPIARHAARRFRGLGSASWALRADAVRMRAELSAGQVLRSGRRVGATGPVPSRSEIEETARGLARVGFAGEAAALRFTHEVWSARHGAVQDVRARPVRLVDGAPMEARTLAHQARATRAERRGRLAQARRFAAAGLDELAEWLSDFGSLDLQTSAVMQGNGLLGVGLAAAVRSGRPEAVFEWSERARHMSAQVLPLRPPPDPQLAEDLSELRMLRADGGDWQSQPRARELRERIRDRQWSTTGGAALQNRVGLDDLREALDEETAVLSFVFSGDSLHVLVTRRSDVALVDVAEWPRVRDALPGLRSDLDMAASVRGRMGEIVRRSLDDRLAALSAVLIDPVLARHAAQRCVITVPGVLSGIPWSMLPGLRGSAVTLAGSASRWIHQRGQETRLETAAFVAGPRVSRAQEEIAAASVTWRSPVIPDPATVDVVTDLSSSVDVLHVAAHGRHSADTPMLSGLDLTDGTLFGYDIDRMAKVPSLVVLSACEAGRSSVRWGEEAIGMTRAWLHAGTRCVIAAPVVVADDDACELLAAMHEGLAAGEEPAVALAAASARTGIVAPFQAHGSGF